MSTFHTSFTFKPLKSGFSLSNQCPHNCWVQWEVLTSLHLLVVFDKAGHPFYFKHPTLLDLVTLHSLISLLFIWSHGLCLLQGLQRLDWFFKSYLLSGFEPQSASYLIYFVWIILPIYDIWNQNWFPKLQRPCIGYVYLEVPQVLQTQKAQRKSYLCLHYFTGGGRMHCD